MIVALASRKASPGVTTLTALLAAYWYEPSAERLVIEADPSGGTLAARWSGAHGLSWDPGLLALSTSRSPVDRSTLAAVSQPVADSVWVAAAPPGSDQVAAGLARLGESGAAALAGADRVVSFVDCGRLGAASPSLPLARRAALTILVCRPRLEEVHALAPAVGELTEAGCTLGLVCVGDGPYPPTEVARTLSLDLLAALPVDERAAEALARHGLGAGRVFRRSTLTRRVEELAGLVRARCVDVVVPDPVAEPVADGLPLSPAMSTLRSGLPDPPVAPVRGGRDV